MADELDTATQNEEANLGENQETPDHEGQETVMGAEMLEYVQSRKAELEPDEALAEAAEQEAPVEESEAAPTEEAAAEDGPKEEAPAESASRTARRALQKEKKLRAEREAFNAEQDKWRSETEESRSKVEAFEQSKANAVMDPYQHLVDLGLSDDDLMDLARETYYKNMPDQATPAVQAEMAAIQRERRLRKLEAQGKAPEKEDEPKGPPPEYQAYEAQYRTGLTQFAATVDAEEFPLAAAYAKEDFNDLVNGMFTAATQNPNKRQGDLTPQECMAAVESFLARQQPATSAPAVERTPTPTQNEEPAEETRTATLRNKTTAAVPNEKHEDDLSYEELRERSRANFEAKMREKQMIR